MNPNPSRPLAMCMSITPFDDRNAVDEAALRAHLRRVSAAGLGVYMASPGSGEGHALTVAETRRVMEIGVEECSGRVPICANPREARDVAGMLELARIAVEVGVDAVQIYQIDGGHGFKPTEQELAAYFRDVICELDHPVIIGCNPVAGYLASVDLLRTLCSEFPQIVAVNVFETSTDYLTACRDALPDRILLFGGQTTAVQSWLLGSSGMLSAAANVVPWTTAALAHFYAAGDIDHLAIASRRLQRFYSAFVHSMAGAAWEKLALKILGLPGGNGVIRRPYLFPDMEAERSMASQLEALDVTAWESEYEANLGARR